MKRPFVLSVCLSVSASLCLSLSHCLSLSLSLCLSASLCLSLSLCLCLPVSLSLCLCLFLCLPVSLCLSLSLPLSLSTLPSPLCLRFIWLQSSLLPHELLLDFHVVVGDKGRGINMTYITIKTPRSCLKVVAGSHSQCNWDLSNKEKTKRCNRTRGSQD